MTTGRGGRTFLALKFPACAGKGLGAWDARPGLEGSVLRILLGGGAVAGRGTPPVMLGTAVADTGTLLSFFWRLRGGALALTDWPVPGCPGACCLTLTPSWGCT